MKTKIIITILVILLIGAGFYLKASLGYKPDRIVVKPKTIKDYFDSGYNENLIKAGFVNTNAAKTFKENQTRNYWKQQGFDFYTNDEMTQFLKDNDFILGEASRYIKNVPKFAGDEIISNLFKLKSDILVYTLTLEHRDNITYQLSAKDVLVKGNNNWRDSHAALLSEVVSSKSMKRLNIPDDWFWDLKYNENIPVQVIGGPNDFNREGLHIIDGILKAIPPKDPIAVVKVNDGYIQIAQW